MNRNFIAPNQTVTQLDVPFGEVGKTVQDFQDEYGRSLTMIEVRRRDDSEIYSVSGRRYFTRKLDGFFFDCVAEIESIGEIFQNRLRSNFEPHEMWAIKQDSFAKEYVLFVRQ